MLGHLHKQPGDYVDGTRAVARRTLSDISTRLTGQVLGYRVPTSDSHFLAL